MSDFIKNKIKWKHQICKIYQKNGHKDSDYFKLQEATSVVSEMISRCKEEYQNHLALKLSDPMTNAKTYWSLLKIFYNGKKVPIILPLITDNKIISDFEAKANHFNSFFASQCTSLNNNNKIPENQTYTTNTKLSLIKSENKDKHNKIIKCI